MKAGTSHGTSQFLGSPLSSAELSCCCSCTAATGIAGGNFPSSSKSGREEENLLCAECAQELLGILGQPLSLSLGNQVKSSSVRTLEILDEKILSAGGSCGFSPVGSWNFFCGASHFLEHWCFKLFHKEFVRGCVQKQSFCPFRVHYFLLLAIVLFKIYISLLK